ncbi:MAG: hypothetical protein HeimC2_08690 [Candidatus Heimdallarchaeota archaeon LC_2]|nr:MAG: hypothetical protein HeimC2_08690 [Candidatus Heimdallarchaeota archaeon LC_2]
MSKKVKKSTISEFVTQVYVIHRTGMVILSRKYADSCIESDPQLVGGLIAAIMTVTSSTASNVTSCIGAEDGRHKLLEFTTTCSRWIISEADDFVVTVLVPNTSPLLEKINLISRVAEQILETYLLYKQFTIQTEETVEDDNDEQIELGNTIDNFVSDVIKEFSGQILDFSKEGSIDHYEFPVDTM